MEIFYKLGDQTNEDLNNLANSMFNSEWATLSLRFEELVLLLQDALQQDILIPSDVGHSLALILGGFYDSFLSRKQVNVQAAEDFYKEVLTQEYNSLLETEQPSSKEELEELTENYFQTAYVTIIDIKNEIQTLIDDASSNAEIEAKAGDLGKWAFAQNRKDVPREQNTDVEDDLENAIWLHLHDDAKLNQSDAHQIKDYVDNHQYLPLLQFPEELYEEVYRGMSLTGEEFHKIFGFEPEDQETAILDIDIQAKPRGATASWTINVNKAREFATSGGKQIAVILAANTLINSGKFILNPERIYDVEQFSEYEEELETIGIGSIKVHRIAYAFPGTATLLTPSLVDKLAGYT